MSLKSRMFWYVRAMPSSTIWCGAQPDDATRRRTRSSPAVGCQHAGQLVEEGRLAGAVGTDDRHDRRARDREVDVAVGDQAAESLGQAADDQDRAARRPSAGCGRSRVGSSVMIRHAPRRPVCRSSGRTPRLASPSLLLARAAPSGAAAGDEALRAQEHHRHQHGAVDEQPVLGELAQQLRQADQHERAHDDAGDAAHPAQDDDASTVIETSTLKLCGKTDPIFDREERAGRGSRRRRRARRPAACSSSC